MLLQAQEYSNKVSIRCGVRQNGKAKRVFEVISLTQVLWKFHSILEKHAYLNFRSEVAFHELKKEK